jgi:hypothetical protein
MAIRTIDNARVRADNGLRRPLYNGWHPQNIVECPLLLRRSASAVINTRKHTLGCRLRIRLLSTRMLRWSRASRETMEILANAARAVPAASSETALLYSRPHRGGGKRRNLSSDMTKRAQPEGGGPPPVGRPPSLSPGTRRKVRAPSHRPDEFRPAIPRSGCSSAEPVSASPARAE